MKGKEDGAVVRGIAKNLAFLIGLALALPYIAWARLGLAFGSEGPYSSAAYAVSIFSGLLGVMVRRAYYHLTLAECSRDLTTHFGTVVTHPTTRIGRNVWIGAYSLIGCSSLEDDVIIGSRVSVLSGGRAHRFSDITKPIRDQVGQYSEVRIGTDSWLGEGCIVMADIGCGSVVGAGAVVVKPGQDYAILVGNPARQVGSRGESPDSK